MTNVETKNTILAAIEEIKKQTLSDRETNRALQAKILAIGEGRQQFALQIRKIGEDLRRSQLEVDRLTEESKALEEIQARKLLKKFKRRYQL